MEPLLAPVLGLSLVFLAGCEAPDPFSGAAVPTPELFQPGIVSTEAREYGITFSPDGTEAYFTRRARGRRSTPEIYVSSFREGAWTAPERAPFSSGYDESPHLTADGSRLLFSSWRDVPGWGPVRGNGNLWVVERTDEGWTAPEPLDGEVNRPRVGGRRSAARSEAGPVVLGDGTLLYATNEDVEWGSDLYVADEVDGAYRNPRPMRLNTRGAETSPALSPDGRHLVFQGEREAMAPGEDELYVSSRTDYGWSTPRLLPEPINTPFNEGYPSFSPDGRYFFFASDRHGRSGDWSIYWVGTEALGLEGAEVVSLESVTEH